MAKLERTKNVTRNILWGTLNKFTSLGMPFIARTIMIYTLGMRYVGLGSLFTSILQVFSFAELGIGNAVVYSMYKPVAEGDDKKICALLSFYRKAYRVIGTVILLLGLAILPFLDHLIAGDVPEDINIYVLFSVFLLNNVLGYYLFAYKYSLLSAFQRKDVNSKVSLLISFTLHACQIGALLLFQNYYVYVVLVPVFTCLNNVCVALITKKYYPQYRCAGTIEQEELRSISKNVGGMVFQKIGGIVLTSVDTIVISSFLGLVSLALYQNYYYIITALFGFLDILMQSMISSVGNSIVTESVEKNYGDFKKFNFMYNWIVSWCTICLLCMYQPFMEIWVGKENMFGWTMVVLFAVYFFTHKWCDMLYVYQEAGGIWWQTKFVPLTAAILNLTLNIILVQTIGLPGILLSTIAAVVLVYAVGYARVLFRVYFQPIDSGLRKYWGRQAVYLATVILASVITVVICTLPGIENAFLRLIVNGILCIIVPNIIFWVCWRRFPEFDAARGVLRRIGRKLKR